MTTYSLGWLIIPISIYRVFQKTAHSFAHDKIWTIRHRIALFAPKCSEKIIVYHSTKNLRKCFNAIT